MKSAATIRRTAAVVLATAMVSVGAAAPAAGQVASGDITTIEVSVVDAQTGQPLPGVCVFSATRSQFTFPDGCMTEQISDEDGNATVTLREGGGEYQLFAWPNTADGYGAQWVGRNGGTGDQRRAAWVRVPDGGTAVSPVVRMDPAGTISGTVTHPDGTPVNLGRVAIGQELFFVGGGQGWVPIDEDGAYTIDVLGPYSWPLHFSLAAYPLQWSGQVATRHRAERIPVTAGETTAYDYQFVPGTEVTIAGDDALGASFVLAHDPLTGDRVGEWAPEFGIVTRPVLGPQPVKFTLWIAPDVEFVGGDDLRSARTFIVRPQGEQQINLG
jgi:hypothetical protein